MNRKMIGRILAGVLAGSVLFGNCMFLQAKSASKTIPVPADASSGGVIHSNIYGEVLVTTGEDGTVDYSFFNQDWPATKELLNALNSGKKIDLEKLLTESSVQIQNITTSDKTAIPNDITNSGAAAAGNRGTYAQGSVYGTNLSDTELQQLQTVVSQFMIQVNPAALSDAAKVRAAHDFLIVNCAQTSRGAKNHAENAWGALIYHKANSRGYARAMKALCDAMGIGCYTVTANNSSSIKDYMWNTVLVDGTWYIVDVFCDKGTGAYPTYLISDAAYETLGMRWNKGNSVPVCPQNYTGKK